MSVVQEFLRYHLFSITGSPVDVATMTRTWDADNLIIPNSVLVASTVKNFTLTDKLHRIRTLVGAERVRGDDRLSSG